MTIAALNDTFTYKHPNGNTKRYADLVAAIVQDSTGASLSYSSAVLSGSSGFSLPSAGFSNPMYLGGTTVNDSTGFDVSPYASIIIAFEGTYTGATGTLQGTLDPTGATGWFTINAITVQPAATNAPSSAIGTTGAAYSVPVGGIQRVRWTVTALSTGTIVVRVSGGAAFNEHQTAQVGAVGMAAHDAAVSGAPVRVGVKALTADAAAVQTGDTADLVATLVGALITRPFSIPEQEWSSGASPITLTSSDQAIKGGAAAGIRNYLTWGTITCGSTWTANTLQFRDGTTVLYEVDLAAGVGFYNLPPNIVLKTTAATALNVKATGAVTGTCKVNAGGYIAP